MPTHKPPRTLPHQTAHKVGVPFVTAIALALLAGLPAKGFASVTGTLAPLAYSPGTMAQLFNQFVGQFFGLLTQLFS